ncbi:MAG: hypothetical protein WCL44_03865 [bacterium]
MSQDWNIQACSGKCGKCDVPFLEDQPYVSTLISAQEGFERRDFCEMCWDKPDVGRIVNHSSWKGVFKPPEPPAKEVLKKENAESLLRNYMEIGDPANKNVVYVLAVMLERKKIFVERDIQLKDDGTQVLVYEHKKTGEIFMIPDPRLRLAQLESVQTEVAGLLGMSSDPVKPEPAPAPVEPAGNTPPEPATT